MKQFYWNTIFPRICDWVMSQPQLTRYRREVVQRATGDVLEIGVGTGLNLPHYPSSVRRVATVDPNPGMYKLLRERVERAAIPVDSRMLGGEQLPFGDAEFDTVVSTWTLCSIPEVHRALSEVHRVLKPSGRFLFLEHGLAPTARLRTWQRRLNPLQLRLAGCRLDLAVRDVVSGVFSRTEVDNFFLEDVPKPYGYMYRGIAIR